MTGSGLRRFSLADQLAFAAASGDFNPIHVDPLAARRLLFGEVVAHGVHAALWALESCWGDEPARLETLEVGFRQPVRVEAPVGFELRERAEGRLRLRLSSEGREVANLDCTCAPAPRHAASGSWSPPIRTDCREVSLAEASGVAGDAPLLYDPRATGALFPRLAGSLPDWQLAVILACDRLLGMECPGRDSLYLGFRLRFHEGGPPAALRYRVEKADPRYHSLRVAVEGAGFSGTLDASYRPAPVPQVETRRLRESVRPGEFAGVRALVVGGSRGLGEVTAKLLAAGGAQVALTYHVGAADAERVVADIEGAGGSAAAFALDVLQSGSALAGWLEAHPAPTLLAYFPTPFISLTETTRFSRELFRRYCRYYVEGFLDAFETVVDRSPELRVLYPSSSALDEVLPKAAEYASAKAAGEALCQHLQKLHDRTCIRWPRLPRMLTDRTATLWPVVTPEPAAVLLEALRGLLAEGPPGR